MSFLIWTIVIILFVLSFVGLFIPFLPASLMIWIGFLLYEFLLNSSSLSMMFWISMVILTIILFVSDILTNKYFVGKFGGSKKSEWGAIVAFLFGVFIYPPFGIIVLPFITVYLIEYVSSRSNDHALRSAVGTIVAFFSSIFVKGFIQLIMIVWFFIAIIF